MSFLKYRNRQEFMGYEAGDVFRHLFNSSLSSVQLGRDCPPGVVLFNESTAQLIHVTHEEFEGTFQPASWEWDPEQIARKEKTHKVKIGWLVKKKEVLEYNAEFWQHPLKVVGFHRESGIYVQPDAGFNVHLPRTQLLGGMFTITPNIEDND